MIRNSADLLSNDVDLTDEFERFDSQVVVRVPERSQSEEIQTYHPVGSYYTVAQLVEHRPGKAKVPGSNPGGVVCFSSLWLES